MLLVTLLAIFVPIGGVVGIAMPAPTPHLEPRATYPHSCGPGTATLPASSIASAFSQVMTSYCPSASPGFAIAPGKVYAKTVGNVVAFACNPLSGTTSGSKEARDVDEGLVERADKTRYCNSTDAGQARFLIQGYCGINVPGYAIQDAEIGFAPVGAKICQPGSGNV